MTEPDVPTVITQLRILAAACRNLNDPYGSKVGDDIAAVAEGLQGWTLVKLPEPGRPDPDCWWSDMARVEAAVAAYLFAGPPFPIKAVRELGLAMLAAADRAEAAEEVPA